MMPFFEFRREYLRESIPRSIHKSVRMSRAGRRVVHSALALTVAATWPGIVVSQSDRTSGNNDTSVTTVNEGERETAAFACEQFAAIIDARPVAADLHRTLEQRATRLAPDVRAQAPINGGRYWIRADYGDGLGAAPYPHLGCFADLRIGLAWFCGADVKIPVTTRSRGPCAVSRRSRPIALPATGCVSLPIALREAILYCAAGSSPTVWRTD